MKESIALNLAKIVLDVCMFCEFTDAELLDEDLAVEMMEQLAGRLHDLNETDKAALVAQFERLSLSYDESEKAEFARGLPDSLGLLG